MLKDHRNWITDFKPPFDPDLWPYHLLVQSKLKKISDLFCCIQIEHYQNKYVGFLHSHFKIQRMKLGKVEKESQKSHFQEAEVMFITDIHKEFTLYIWEKSLRSYLIAVYKYFHREKKPIA